MTSYFVPTYRANDGHTFSHFNLFIKIGTTCVMDEKEVDLGASLDDVKERLGGVHARLDEIKNEFERIKELSYINQAKLDKIDRFLESSYEKEKGE